MGPHLNEMGATCEHLPSRKSCGPAIAHVILCFFCIFIGFVGQDGCQILTSRSLDLFTLHIEGGLAAMPAGPLDWKASQTQLRFHGLQVLRIHITEQWKIHT